MNYEILGLVLAALLMISGGIATLYKMMNSIRKEREHENERTLQAAKDYIDQKYHTLEQELAHQKDTHEGKVVELSQKIEELREEMRRHHTQLVDLLIKMTEKK
jgi:uncharacterized coiled-coil protein SlyX